MNKLSSEQRGQILQLLCEGMSIRAVTRVTGPSKNTMAKLLNDAGRAVGAYQDQAFQNLQCKRIEAHSNAIALHFAYYNFVRVHQTLRASPAMPEGVTDRLWEMSDLVAIVEAADRKPGKRGPYKSRAQNAA